MKYPLTIAYITGRPEPMIHWFFDSLHRECKGDYSDISVVIVDRLIQERPLFGPLTDVKAICVPPMPNVWQGQYRLTKRDYFAASNARNTALCLAPDGWIAYVDDLSVLMPGWLNSVRDAMAGNYIVLGAYKKVLKLYVDEDGNARYEEFAPGVDSRWKHGDPTKPVPAGGSWMFGCSVAMPVEALLRINGWDSDADSLSGEDYIAGIMMERAGYKFMYDLRMLTLESEERHHDGSALPRFDKGKSPNDKSHALLNMVVKGGRNVAPNYFGEGGIRKVRDAVLRGEPFPIIRVPEADWFDGQLLSEL